MIKVKYFILSVLVGVFTLTSCEEKNTDLGAPALTLGESEITLPQNGGDTVLTINSTRDWMATSNAEWLVVTPESGKASAEAQEVTVTALENTEMDREATVTFTIGMISRYLTVTQTGPKGSADKLILYSNNFDKEEATKTYGSGESWPYLYQFEGWKNETGTGIANIEYAFKGMSARANSTSNSNYSDYEGSGSNNIFFGSDAYIAIKNIALNGAQNIALSFGSEKYSKENGSVFTPAEYHIWLSADGVKWVEFKDYTFAGGQTEGRWNIASGSFILPEGTDTLSVCMSTDVASSYRMDDLKLEISSEAGTAIDFANAVEKDFNAGGNSNNGGNNNGGSFTPPANIIDVTVAEFLAAEVSTTEWYRISGTVGGPINATFGNFDIVDGENKVYVYGIKNWANCKSLVQEGGTIVVVGQRGEYKQSDGTVKDEVLEGYVEKYNGAEVEIGGNSGGGDNGGSGDFSDTGEYDPKNLTWTLGEKAYDKSNGQKATMNGVKVNNLLKLGTSKLCGNATLHVPAGTKKIGGYFFSWNGESSSVSFSVNGTVVYSVKPASNSGVAGSEGYNITATEQDYYEFEINATAATDVKVETTDSSNPRAVFIALTAITE